MKRWIASILAAMGLVPPAHGGEKVQTIDPSSILFTIPTISNDLAPLDALKSEPQPDDPQMHEDDWCQVEYFQEGYLSELKRILGEYKAFEASNRQVTTIEGKQYMAWRKAYVRRVTREPLLSGDQPVAQIVKIVGGELGPSPALFSSSSWSGCVKNGFTVRVGRNVELYGYVTDGGIPVLGASVGPEPDDQSLVTAFSTLNAALGLVLVDWKSQFILVGITPDGKVQTWRP